MMLSAGRLLESTVTTTTATVSNTITNPAQPPTVAIVFDDAAAVFAAICACAFSAIGILGNLITILALALNPKLRSHATTAFVLSLCVSDLLFCSVSLPLTAVRYINKAWIMGETLCKIFPVIFYSNVAFSLLSMVCITLNRYILIAYNSYYTRIYRSASIAGQLTFIWLFSFGIMLPPLFGLWGQLGLDAATFSCTILRKDGHSIKKFLFVIGFFLPCAVIICSYSCIYWTVRQQRRKLNRHLDYVDHQKKNVVVTSSRSSSSSANSSNNATVVSNKATTTPTIATATSAMQRNRCRDREDARLTTMMLIIFLCFLASFLPLTLVNIADEQNRYPWLNIVASVLAWASSVVNPFVYAASNRTYRVAYYKLFARLKFWGAPLAPIISKSYQPSRDSAAVAAAAATAAAGGNRTNRFGGASALAIGVNNRLIGDANNVNSSAKGGVQQQQQQKELPQTMQASDLSTMGENLLM